MNKTLIFAPFEKVEEQDDGTLIVSGIASSESEDHDGEIVKADAVRAALPDYMAFGAVREMHKPIAAGTAISADVGDDGITRLEALVVDPVSVKKVQTGVLKGFSLGGMVTKRNKLNKKQIDGIKLTEISLVDRPANPDAIITLTKFDESGAIVGGELFKFAIPAGRRKAKKPKTKAERDAADALKKSLYDVSRLADLLCSLSSIYRWAEEEKAVEGDDSTVPEQLKAHCVAIAATLRDMCDEETAELLGLMGVEDDQLFAAAEKAIEAGDLQKRGAKFSTTTKKALGTIHKSMKQCCDMMDKLGYDHADEPEDRDMDATEKAAIDKQFETLNAKIDLLAKAAPPAAPAAPVKSEADELKDRLTAAESALKKATDDLAKANETSQKLADAVVKSGAIRSVPKTADADPIAKTTQNGAKPDFKSEMRQSWGVPLSPVRGVGR